MAEVPKQLTPLKPRGDPRSDAIRAKLKGSGSDKRKLAQKINAIPRMNPANKEAAALEIVRNPEASALQIAGVIEELLEDDTISKRTKIELLGKMVQAHTAIHGIKQRNLNLNVDVKLEDIIGRWKKKRELKIIGT